MLLIMFVLLVASVILTLLGILFDQSKDSHFENDGHCSFNDLPCKKGLELEGGCFILDRPNGYKCNSSCYYDEPEDSIYNSNRCEYREYSLLGNLVQQSVCVGTSPKGVCAITSDCPNITFAEFVTVSSSKSCDSLACYYTLNLSGGENSDITVDCDVSSPALQQLCYAKLNTSDPIVSENCLVAEPICTETNSTSNTTGCLYFFRDVPPQQIIVV